ncbi:MAG: hypothetical protein HY808_14895 [Nitrospirae bacterium]|nr:hypothetical protein [Nitrospirota bacterium]
MPSQVRSTLSKDDICEICDSIKDKEIEGLKNENKKLKKLVEFLKAEIHSLELKTALSEKAIPIKKIIKEFTSTPEGKAAWQAAWDERAEESEKVCSGRENQQDKILQASKWNGPGCTCQETKDCSA